MRKLVLLALAGSVASAQPPTTLTLSQAREMALRSHPRIQAAGAVAQAVDATVKQARAPLYPSLGGNFTASGAEHNSTLSAGALTTSSLYSRVASGIVASQLVTDFGRTSSLTATAKLRAAAEGKNVANTKAQVLLEVTEAYYETQSADAVLRAAKAAVDNRAVTLRQVRALAQSALKSTVDVSFAEVALSEAELQLYRAENDVQAGRARLAAALGLQANTDFQLTDESLPPALPATPEELVGQALKDRPDSARCV